MLGTAPKHEECDQGVSGARALCATPQYCKRVLLLILSLCRAIRGLHNMALLEAEKYAKVRLLSLLLNFND